MTFTTPPIKAWSYSRYSIHKQCPLLFKCKFIDKLHEEVVPAMLRGRDIHKEGEHYLDGTNDTVPESYGKFKPLMVDLRDMGAEAESQIAFDKNWSSTGWFSSNVYVRVIVDAALFDTASGHGEIIDFKTGKKYAENVEQIDLFSLAAFHQHKYLQTVTARLWYLDAGQESIYEYTRDDMERMTEEWTERAQPLLNDVEFKPRLNDKCRWCNFSKDRGGPCPYDA